MLNRFINAERLDFYHQSISQFSDTTGLMSFGRSRCFANDKMSWIADFLFKGPGNYSLNKHSAHITFFSDREIFDHDYAMIEDLDTNYDFIVDADNRSIIPQYIYELSQKQYSKISNKSDDFDIIEYICPSAFYAFLTNDEAEIAEEEPSGTELQVNHEFSRVPAYTTYGYRVNLDSNQEYTTSSTQEFYDAYVLAQNNIGFGTSYERSKINPGSINMFYNNWGEDLSTTEFYLWLFGIETGIQRLINCELNIDNPFFTYVSEGSSEWILYPYQSNLDPQIYKPFIGSVVAYNDDWLELNYYSNVFFFPEIFNNGILEPPKMIIDWGASLRTGKAAFNSSLHLHEPEDQSRIVFNICRNMLEESLTNTKQVPNGIDFESERNRRYSAVTTTEPYFVASPIASGAVIDYMFIRWYGGAANFNYDNTALLQDHSLYLKVKAPLSVIEEINRILTLNESNTDILHTIIIKNPRSTGNLLLTGAEDYIKFRDNANYDFIKRQDNYLDGIYNGKMWSGTNGVFYLNSTLITVSEIEAIADLYSDDKIKVCGAGFICKTQVDSNGNVIANHDEYLALYCTNFTPISSYASGDDTFTPIANDEWELVANDLGPDEVESVKKYEIFKPMIKLTGINGYIKIIERNPHFKISRASDGMYEVIYNVEFPYAPGSYSERVRMGFIDGYHKTQILYKKSYINAGSNEAHIVGFDKRIDLNNKRYAPYGDDSFVRYEIFNQAGISGIIETDPYTSGGSKTNISSKKTSRLSYPAESVFKYASTGGLQFIKPRRQEFRRRCVYDPILMSIFEDEEDIANFISTGTNGSQSSSTIPIDQKFDRDILVTIAFKNYGDSIDIGSDIDPTYLTSVYHSYNPIIPYAPKYVDLIIPSYGYPIYISDFRLYVDDAEPVEMSTIPFPQAWIPVIGGTDMSIVNHPVDGRKCWYKSPNADYNSILRVQLPSGVDFDMASHYEIRFDFKVYYPHFGTLNDTPAKIAYGNANKIKLRPWSDESLIAYSGAFLPKPQALLMNDHECEIYDLAMQNKWGTKYSRDVKIFFMMDNRQWKFGENKYSSYINKENPSYVFSINSETLFQDFTTYIQNHEILPDIKRWIYSYFMGVGHSATIPELNSDYDPDTHLATSILRSIKPKLETITSVQSQSCIVIDTWNIEDNRWEQFTPAIFDTLKIPGKVIVSDAMIYNDDPEVVFTDMTTGIKICRIYVGSYIDGTYVDPENFEQFNEAQSNLILYNKNNGYSYHIVSIDKSDSILLSLLRVYIIFNPDTDELPIFDPSDIPADWTEGPIQIRNVSLQMSKNPLFNINTSQVIQGSESGIIGKFIDIRQQTDIDKYIDSDNMMKFRIRIIPKREYPVSNESDGSNVIQYIGEPTSHTAPDWDNFPWGEDDVFDEIFDFSKIGISEMVTKIGANYFKTASK